MHHGLGDLRLGQQRAFHPFGRNVAAVRGDDQIGLAPFDPEPSGRIAAADVARRKGGGRRFAANGAQTDRAGQQNLAILG